MPYLIFAWVASILYASEVIVSKIVSKYSLKNPWLFNFVWSLIILTLTFPLVLRAGLSWPRDWFSLSLASFFYAASGILYILALYRLDVSIISPLFNMRSVMGVILGVLFLNEVLSAEQAVLITVIFIASVLVTLDERLSYKSFFHPAVLIILVGTLCLSLMGIFINRSVAENGYWPTTLFIPLISQLLLLLTLPKFVADLGSFGFKNFLMVVLIAVAGTFGNLAANKALAENVGLTTVIISLPLSMVMVSVLSLVAPRLLEHHTPRVYMVRFAAAAVMVFAAIKLSLWV